MPPKEKIWTQHKISALHRPSNYFSKFQKAEIILLDFNAIKLEINNKRLPESSIYLEVKTMSFKMRLKMKIKLNDNKITVHHDL